MKRLFLLIALFSSMIANGQLTTILTPGNGNFQFNNSLYPFNSIIMIINATDTSLIQLNFINGASTTTSVIVPYKKRVKYVDGRTGLPFVSITRLKQFYDSFMVSPPFTTTLNDAVLNFSGDATAAHQVTQIAYLDSISKYITNERVTQTVLGAADTLVIPAGSVLIGGIITANGAALALGDITGCTAIEKRLLSSALVQLPMQSYRGLATAHTITAISPITVFILKLH